MIELKRNKSHHFYIECKNDSCRHNAMVPVSALLKEYGEDITSDEVLRRARCTKCGFQGNNQMRLVYVGKSALAQTGSAVNQESIKDVEVYWLCKRSYYFLEQSLLLWEYSGLMYPVFHLGNCHWI